MRNIWIVMCIVLVTAWSPVATMPAAAQTPEQEFVIAARDFLPHSQPQGILPSPSARISNKEAAARVRQSYRDHKILSVNLIESKGPPVYRVKTLSEDGVVKYVFVDGTSGDVFE